MTRSNACGGARGTFESGRVLYYELRDVADADPLVPSGGGLYLFAVGFRFYRGVRIIFYVYLFDCRVVCSVRCFIGVAARGHGSAWRAAAGPGRGGRGPRGARGAGGAFEFCARFSHTSHTRICRVPCRVCVQPSLFSVHPRTRVNSVW